MASSTEIPRCPVCRARFRSTRRCSRCGADLGVVMMLIARSYGLRQEARTAIGELSYPRANRLAEEAQSLHATPQGHRLLQLTAALTRGFDHWLED